MIVIASTCRLSIPPSSFLGAFSEIILRNKSEISSFQLGLEAKKLERNSVHYSLTFNEKSKESEPSVSEIEVTLDDFTCNLRLERRIYGDSAS